VSTYFDNTNAVRTEIARVLTPARLSKYSTATSDDLERTLQLYVWNSALAAAFQPVLGMVEIALRNALDARLSAFYAPAWYDHPAFRAVDMRFAGLVETGKGYIAKRLPPGTPIAPPQVIAELSLGFWVSLLRPAYGRSLWPILRATFPRYTRRSKAMEPFEPLVGFRNRVAHHESIFDRKPREMYDNLLRGAELLSADLPDWIEHHSRVREVLSAGPSPTRCRF
jgi:hypothetical protein